MTFSNPLWIVAKAWIYGPLLSVQVLFLLLSRWGWLQAAFVWTMRLLWVGAVADVYGTFLFPFFLFYLMQYERSMANPQYLLRYVDVYLPPRAQVPRWYQGWRRRTTARTE